MTNNQNPVFPENIDSFFFTKAWEVFLENKETIIKLILVSSLVFAFFIEYISHLVLPELEQIDFQDPELALEHMSTFIYYYFIANSILLLPKAFFLVFFISLLPLMYEGTIVNFSMIKNVNLYLCVKFFVYSIIIIALETIGVFLCIIPGLYVIVQFALLQYVIVLEGEQKLLTRSMNVVSGYQLKVLSIFILYLLITILLQMEIFPLIFGVESAAETPDVQTVDLIGFLKTYIQQVIVSFILYYFTQLYFQIYMMSRINLGEIEVVTE